MMMWEKLKLVAVGRLIAAGLTSQALSQQAQSDDDSVGAAAQTAAQPAEKPNEKTDGDRRWVRSPAQWSTIEVDRGFLRSPPAPIPGGVPTERR